MIKRLCSLALAMLAVFAACATPAAAQPVAPAAQPSPVQASPDTITGVVRDVTGGVIRGAEVIALPVTGAEARVLTGDDGRFTVTPSGTGAVVVLVHSRGFAEARQTIEVGSNRLNLEVVLTTATLQETVGVSAPMPRPPPPPPPPPPLPKIPKPKSLPLPPVVNSWYAGLTTAVAVGNSGGAVGGEIGVHFRQHLDVFVAGSWFNNVVTDYQQGLSAPLLVYLQATSGKAAAASVKRPAVNGAVGARWAFEGVRLPARFRPYAQVGIGGALVERKPTFTLGGSDVTGTLPLYGVVLGADLTRTEYRPAATAGFGVLKPMGAMYLDVAYRLTYINTTGSPTKVNGLHIGVGWLF